MQKAPPTVNTNNQSIEKLGKLNGDTVKRNGRLKMFLIVAVCAAPMIASYFTYYVIKPESRTNYGDLLDPSQYVIPPLGVTELDGTPTTLGAFKGKWVMLQVGSADCQKECKDQLFEIRQLRLMQGKERERIERVWLITDEKKLDMPGLKPFEGTHLLRVNPESLKAWLPTDAGTSASDHIYLIDPRSNLMMRFPKGADPYKVKADLSKLLRASAIG